MELWKNREKLLSYVNISFSLLAFPLCCEVSTAVQSIHYFSSFFFTALVYSPRFMDILATNKIITFKVVGVCRTAAKVAELPLQRTRSMVRPSHRTTNPSILLQQSQSRLGG